MTLQSDKNKYNKNTENNHSIDDGFEKVRQWMNNQEIVDYQGNQPASLLKILLHRHEQCQELVQALFQDTDTDPAFTRKLLSVDQCMQVNHFLYQSVLVRFYNDYQDQAKAIRKLINWFEQEQRQQSETTRQISTEEKQMLKLIREHFQFQPKNMNYEYVHFNLLSIFETVQKLLFLNEENPDNETKVHIYNLIELAKDQIHKDEYELLSQLKEYTKLNLPSL